MNDPLRLRGAFAERDSVADLIHTGGQAEGAIEDEISEWWPSLSHTSTDWYDNSLEIYFEDHVVDLEATPEQQEQIWKWGFSRFWLNFKGGRHKDGTERAYVKPRAERKGKE